MTRAIRTFCAAALAALLGTAALPAAAADAPPAPVDAATAEAAAKGEVCPAAVLNAEQLQVRQQAAIADIGRMLAEQETADDPEFRVLNGTGYNYRMPASEAAPPASQAPASGTKRH